MGPQRLFVLAVLLYVAWRLVRSLIQEKINSALRRQEQAKSEHEAVAQDTLVEDPVCRTLIPKRQALRLRQDGKNYYFCSDACCDKFIGRTEGATE